jgi:hypothetical protein
MFLPVNCSAIPENLMMLRLSLATLYRKIEKLAIEG